MTDPYDLLITWQRPLFVVCKPIKWVVGHWRGEVPRHSHDKVTLKWDWCRDESDTSPSTSSPPTRVYLSVRWGAPECIVWDTRPKRNKLFFSLHTSFPFEISFYSVVFVGKTGWWSSTVHTGTQNSPTVAYFPELELNLCGQRFHGSNWGKGTILIRWFCFLKICVDWPVLRYWKGSGCYWALPFLPTRMSGYCTRSLAPSEDPGTSDQTEVSHPRMKIWVSYDAGHGSVVDGSIPESHRAPVSVRSSTCPIIVSPVVVVVYLSWTLVGWNSRVYVYPEDGTRTPIWSFYFTSFCFCMGHYSCYGIHGRRFTNLSGL